MTQPIQAVKPVRCWAVVARDDYLDPDLLELSEVDAQDRAAQMNRERPEYAPFTVIRCRLVPEDPQ